MPHPLAALAPTETAWPPRSSQTAVNEASDIAFTLAIDPAQDAEPGEAIPMEADLTDDAAASLIAAPDATRITPPEAVVSKAPEIDIPVVEKAAGNNAEVVEAIPKTPSSPDLDSTSEGPTDRAILPDGAQPEPPTDATLTGDAPAAETLRSASPKADTAAHPAPPQSALPEPTYGKATAGQSLAHPAIEPEQPATQEAAGNEGDQPPPPRVAVTAPQVSNPVPTSPVPSGPAAPPADIALTDLPTATEEPAIPAPSSRDMPTAPTEAARSVVAVPPRVTEQVVRLLQNADPTTGGDLELRLDPPELGRVRISFSGLEGSLTATLSAERPEVEALIRRHADELLRNLAEAGFDGASLNFASHGAEHEKGGLGPVLALEEDVALESATGQIGSRVLADGQLDIRL